MGEVFTHFTLLSALWVVTRDALQQENWAEGEPNFGQAGSRGGAHVQTGLLVCRSHFCAVWLLAVMLDNCLWRVNGFAASAHFLTGIFHTVVQLKRRGAAAKINLSSLHLQRSMRPASPLIN